MTAMYNPPHPGEFIKETYLLPFNLSERAVAERLGVSPSTFNRLIKENHSISPEMALRLSAVLGRSPESWLHMQDKYNLWQAERSVDFKALIPFNFDELDENSSHAN
jgi:addiction module HigA family antidote